MGAAGVLAVSAASAQEARVENIGPPSVPPPTVEAVATLLRPDWIKVPTNDQIASRYPSRAPKGLEAHVVLRCRVKTAAPMPYTSVEISGIDNCKIVSETPEGYGFGKAAMELTRMFALRPTDQNKVSVAGREVNVPIRWNVPAYRPTP